MTTSVASMPPSDASSAKRSTRPKRSPRSMSGSARTEGSPMASTSPRKNDRLPFTTAALFGSCAPGSTSSSTMADAATRTIHAARRPLRAPQWNSTAGRNTASGATTSSVTASTMCAAMLSTRLPTGRIGGASGSCERVSVKRSVRGERKQRGDARALDRVLQLALMQRAGAGDAARQDLPALGDELLQHLHVFVVDVLELLHAELADALAAIEELLLAALRSAVAARSSAL